ncbi:hypothetical protein EDC96DRAFT_545356 [Choanephora cucurbitarum]|nr:hypothetical protein EDC96DRAFT_545356 [Choanephora cucurbitarum]
MPHLIVEAMSKEHKHPNSLIVLENKIWALALWCNPKGRKCKNSFPRELSGKNIAASQLVMEAKAICKIMSVILLSFFCFSIILITKYCFKVKNTWNITIKWMTGNQAQD